MFSSKRILIVIPILWLGFVLSISFMEAWLKFQAEGVTQQIGLSVGKLVFGVLNKVELFFFLLIILVFSLGKQRQAARTTRYVILSLVIILMLQTFYLLPILDQRADMIIRGEKPSASYFHFYYVVLEIFKALGLYVFIHRTLTKCNG